MAKRYLATAAALPSGPMRPWLLGSGPEDALASLADALDAGLPAESALASAGIEVAHPSGTPIHEILAAALADLSTTDRTVLRAAENGGSLPAALRRLADDRRTRGERRRELAGRVAYPAAVVMLAAAVSALFAGIGMPGLGLGFWGGTMLGFATLVALTLGARRRMHTDPSFEPRLLGEAWKRAASTPYFEALLALYAAGVRIDDAHREATGACWHAALRARLVAAGTSLTGGAPLAESLERASACEPWTRAVLRDAERSGTLEAGLGQVITRLRSANAATARRAVRIVGGLAYTFAILVVLLTLARFYGGLSDRFGSIGR
jgi:type II secretory pathway component PulF